MVNSGFNVICVLCVFATSGLAQTFVGGPITTSATWDTNGSPYVLTSRLVVEAGVTLTIEPGVVVRFQDNTQLYVSNGANLEAAGTSTNPILFIPDNASVQFNLGLNESAILVLYNGGTLSNCIFRGFVVRGSDSNYPGIIFTWQQLNLNSCRFESDSSEYYLVLGIQSAFNCGFVDNYAYNELAEGTFTGTFTNCTFVGNTAGQISCGQTFIGNLFYYNRGGWMVYQFSGSGNNIHLNTFSENNPADSGLVPQNLSSVIVSASSDGSGNNFVGNEDRWILQNSTPTKSLNWQGNWWSTTNDSLINAGISIDPTLLNRNVNCSSPLGGVDTAAPLSPPLRFHVAAISNEAVRLSWQNYIDSSLGRTLVTVYSNNNPNVPDSILETSDTVLSIEGLLPGKPYFFTSRSIATSGKQSYSSRTVSATPGSDLDEVGILVSREYTLEQNYPNPFNPTTTIRYGLSHRSHVLITVYNTLGQKVTELVNGEIEAGSHEVKFDGSNLASGVYFYRLQAGSYTETKKLLLVR